VTLRAWVGPRVILSVRENHLVVLMLYDRFDITVCLTSDLIDYNYSREWATGLFIHLDFDLKGK
jgi:hypothetical protein